MERAKVVLITGASTGIGKAAAIEMRGRGWRVFATVRRYRDIIALTKIGRGLIEPLMMDVTDEQSVTKAFETIQERAGRLNALVNNAGISTLAPVETLSVDELRQHFEVNLFGLHRVTQAALPLLRASKGRIVNISSLAGEDVFPFNGAYAASKHAVEALSDALRMELHGTVKVIVIQPGAVKTAIWDKAVYQPIPTSEHYPPEPMRELSERFWQFGQQGCDPQKVALAIGNALELPWPVARWVVTPRHHFWMPLLRYAPSFMSDRFKRWTIKWSPSKSSK